MSTPLEGIIRPFQSEDVTPQKFTRPGQGSVPMVRLQIGYTGQVKTLGWSMSSTESFKLGQRHKESAPTASQALTAALDEVHTQVSGG
jgi:hypothetical protein